MARRKDSKFPRAQTKAPKKIVRKCKDIDALYEAFDDCVWPFKSYTPGLFVDSKVRRYIISVRDLEHYTKNYKPVSDETQRWLVFNSTDERVDLFFWYKPRRDYKHLEDL